MARRRAFVIAGAPLLLAIICLWGMPVFAAPVDTNPSQEERIFRLERQLKMLSDRDEIRDLVMEYGRSIDARDWDGAVAIYTDEIDVDYSSMPGAPTRKRVGRNAWVAELKRFFSQMSATQHLTDVLKLQITGDTAHAITMLHAQHYHPNSFGDPVQRMIGTYDAWFVRTASGWRISRVRPNLAWNEGNYWIFLNAAGVLAPAKPTP